MTVELNLIASLHSYPSCSLELPRGVQLLLPRGGYRQTCCPLKIRNRLQKALLRRLDPLQIADRRVLLILPDHTRRSEASHSAIDALLGLLHGRCQFSLTLLFGLGSHPPMGQDRIVQLLGHHRWQALQQMSVPILEHTTLQPLPCKPLDVSKPEWMGPGHLRLDLPAVLWDSHLVVVAGNTELHPYESRCGSGGLNKMLVIGLGNQAIIHHTHAIKVLMDPATKDRRENSRFVQLLDYYGRAITHALMRSQLRSPPLGFSLLSLDPVDSAVHGVWVGEEDPERSVLTSRLHQERTCKIAKPLDFVISDSEVSKSTDFLAGGRSLHVLCSLDRPSRPVLCRNSPVRTAFLLNACHEAANADGIGNRGTKLHLDVLAQCVQSELQLLLQHTHCTPKLLKRSRMRALMCWHRYLHLVSIQDEFLHEFSASVIRVSSHQCDSYRDIEARGELSRRLTPFQAIPGVYGQRIRALIRSCLDGDWHAVMRELSIWQQSLPSHAFADGGQRALRFLLILQRFERFVLVTDNQSVLAYIQKLSPDLRQYKSASWFDPLPLEDPFRFDLLGLSGIDLRLQTPTDALQKCLRAHHLLRDAASGSACAFVQNPILVEV